MLLAAALAALALPAAASAAEPQARIVVRHDAGLTQAERADVRADAGALAATPLPIARTEVLTVTADDAAGALARLREDPDVAWAEPDGRLHAMAPVPDDPEFGKLWGFRNTGQFGGTPGADMDVLDAWDRSTGAGQTVAVVDTWVDASHPDLVGQVTTGPDFTGTTPPGTTGDGTQHGTHVSGTVAARRGNRAGVAGVAPDAHVLAVRALDSTGSGWDSRIAAAFDYAAGQARIVSASLGGPSGSAVLTTVIRSHPNTLFVVAAGNDGRSNDTTPTFPCNVDAGNVLCVGASTPADGIASFSNTGAASVDLFAPGVQIDSTVPGPGYAYLSGTSMATPAVAGEAALVLARAPQLSTGALKEILLSSAVVKPAFQGRSVSGGRADAARATALAGGVAAPADADADGRPDGADNCPAAANPTQADADGDGAGDACDATPRGPDADGDGRPALDDHCPAVPAATADGCPPPDRDGDGRPNALDACPSARAATPTGCPVPAVRRLAVALVPGRRGAVVRLAADRAASARVTLERRSCARGGCRWVRLLRRTVGVRTRTVALTVRAPRGRTMPHGAYRVRAVLSSAAGTARPVTRTVRL
jgi:subtilisin family serine protease